MQTDDLIRALGADAAVSRHGRDDYWGIALAASGLIVATIFFLFIGPRPDIAAAAGTLRFDFKFVVTILLAATAFAALRALEVPGVSTRRSTLWLLLAPALLAAALVAELFAVPAGDWATRLIGTNARYCLTLIPLMGIGPLAVTLSVLRRGAPTRPRLAGAVAGLLAGGLAATFYAANCTDDSPLFVATWYPVSIGMLVAIGSLAGPRVLRW